MLVITQLRDTRVDLLRFIKPDFSNWVNIDLTVALRQ
jgi:hypothetical protein